MLTGIKDTDFMIMDLLDDESLLNLCLTDAKLCQDDHFWRRRYIKNFGKHASEFKPAHRKWRRHYLKTLDDLGRFEKDPEQFLKHINWSNEGAEKSYYVTYEMPQFPGVPTLNPFLKAPEWVMNNFYLLNIGPGIIDGKWEKKRTPSMFFEDKAKTERMVRGRKYIPQMKFR